MNRKYTHADARRWLESHERHQVETVQTDGRGHILFQPGPRVLSRATKLTWKLDGSEVRITPAHEVAHVSANMLVLFWKDEDGMLIHTTAYGAL